MPKVERTGVYRNAKGHGLFLRKDRIVGECLLAEYALDENAVLSPVRRAIADAENGYVALRKAPVAGVDVTTKEIASTGEVVEPPIFGPPIPVAPGGRRKRNSAVETPEDDAPPIETPEDGATVETPEDDDEDAE